MFRSLCLTIVFWFILSTSHAVACVPVTSLSLVAGGPSVHISITDQNCNVINPAPLPNPTNITWSFVNSNAFFTVVADATGFTFTGLQPLSAGSATPTYNIGTLVLHGAPISISIVSNITSIQTVQQ